MAKKTTYESTRSSLLTKALTRPINSESIRLVAEELDENPQFSLDPDPTGDLGMSEQEKSFIRWYVQHRNVAVAAQLAEIAVEDGMAIYRSFACQSELRRIDMAWKLRQLNMSTLSLEQIGSMLTSYIFDQVPASDQLSTKDKMSAMKMIMDIHALKQKVIEEAKPIDAIDVESQVKDMSVDALKSLIEKIKDTDKENDEKESMIKVIDSESALSNDDLHYLRSLSVDDLKRLLDEQKDVKLIKHDDDAKTIPNPASASVRGKTLTPVDDDDIITGDDVTGA